MTRASLRGALGHGDHAGLARHDGKGSTTATASGRVDRWRSRAERKRSTTMTVLLFIDGKDAYGVDSSRTSSPRSLLRVTTQESGEKRSAVAAAWRRRQAGRWRLAWF